MKYQSMKCSCNPEPTERGALVFSWVREKRDKKRSLIFILGFVCLTSLKLKYEGNVSESPSPDIWSSIGQKQLKIPFVILEIRVLSNISPSLKPNFLLLIRQTFDRLILLFIQENCSFPQKCQRSVKITRDKAIVLVILESIIASTS